MPGRDRSPVPSLSAPTPAGIVAAAGSLWVADREREATILRVDPDAGTRVDRIPVGGAPGALAAGGGSIWVATTLPGARQADRHRDGSGHADDPARRQSERDRLRRRRALGRRRERQVADRGRPGRAGTVRETVTLTTRPTAIAVGAEAVWVASHDEGTVTQVDPRAEVPVATVAVGQGPSALAVGAGSVWVANELDGTVSRIDPRTASVVATVATGSGPTALAVAQRLDLGREQVLADGHPHRYRSRPRLGDLPLARSADRDRGHRRHGVGRQRTPSHATAAGHSCSCRTVSSPRWTPRSSTRSFPPQLHGLAYDALVAFNHTGGPRGLQLVPDLALALPTPSDGGRTYAFRLRAGIRYSDGRPRASQRRPPRVRAALPGLVPDHEPLRRPRRRASNARPAACTPRPRDRRR